MSVAPMASSVVPGSSATAPRASSAHHLVGGFSSSSSSSIAPSRIASRSVAFPPPSARRGVVASAAAPGSIADWIERNLDFGEVTSSRGQGGSGWAEFTTYETSSGKKLFVKTSRRDAEMFIGEGHGLRAMHATNTLVIPEVHHAGATPEGCRDGNSFIVMDYLTFGARGDQAEFGRQLARMHKAEPAVEEARRGQFGFTVNNTCGDTPQPNGWMDDWVEFYRERRIGHQLRLARDGQLSELGNRVMERMPEWFEPFDPETNPIRPSILHGDLWSGNIGTVDGAPSVFDPAVYYGHNEAEFGMSWCAGFSDAFYDAYFEVMPKTEAFFEERRQLYLLYHYLNHYNLFGGGYKSQCVGIMNRLLR